MNLIWSFLSCLPIYWWRKRFQLQYIVNTTTQFVPFNNSNKFQITIPLSNQTSWDTNRTTPFQFQNRNRNGVLDKKQRTAEGMPHLKPTDFDVTKHSDYFVWKDTSERVARRCDDTVDKKQVNFCVLKYLFFWRELSNNGELSNQKYCQKTPEMLSPTRYQCHVFKISRLTPQKIHTYIYIYICKCDIYIYIYVKLVWATNLNYKVTNYGQFAESCPQTNNKQVMDL